MLLALSQNSIETVVLFFAMLAVLCELFVIAIVAVRVAAIFSPAARSLFDRITFAVGPLALPFAFAVALVTTLGSLFLSEVAGYIPCNLCWYQRICIYPLVPILGVAWWRRDRNAWPYPVVLAAICIPISAYHYLIEWFPTLESSACDPSNPCSQVYVREFGYLSIPFMAATCAVTVITLMLLLRRYNRATD